MVFPLDSILDLVKRKVAERKGGAFGSGGLLGQLTELIGQRAHVAKGGQQTGKVRPASQDPYGDPADRKLPNDVKPASEDPYGDPADQK